ncbi:MAG: helix-turn-helix transcriptional regulator [Chloroflexi bacterium]|nr:helix-turn-helix transcriptional regulator [Chloroflexota bacterium]
MRSESTLKNRVRELRVRLELRQSDLAREIGVTRQTILAIEKGRLNPSINIALKAARVLREPVDYVFYLDPSSEERIDAAAKRDKKADPSKAKDRNTIWKLTAK